MPVQYHWLIALFTKKTRFSINRKGHGFPWPFLLDTQEVVEFRKWNTLHNRTGYPE